MRRVHCPPPQGRGGRSVYHFLDGAPELRLPDLLKGSALQPPSESRCLGLVSKSFCNALEAQAKRLVGFGPGTPWHKMLMLQCVLLASPEPISPCVFPPRNPSRTGTIDQRRMQLSDSNNLPLAHVNFCRWLHFVFACCNHVSKDNHRVLFRILCAACLSFCCCKCEYFAHSFHAAKHFALLHATHCETAAVTRALCS